MRRDRDEVNLRMKMTSSRISGKSNVSGNKFGRLKWTDKGYNLFEDETKK